MKIFGIDPGLRSTGWGVITIKARILTYCDDGMIRPKPEWADAARLHVIAAEISKMLTLHQPDIVCIEEIFVAQNPASALKLGMARGAALVAVAEQDIPVRMISARRVKQNVTGSGRADKAQVTAMVSRLLKIVPKGEDSADALAIAIAAMNDQSLEGKSQASKNQDPKPQGGGLDAAIQRALAKEDRA